MVSSNQTETTVELWDGSTQTVPTLSVTPLLYDRKAIDRLKKLKMRLAAIAASGSLEEPGELLIDYFSHRESQEELTPLESKLLTVMERECLKTDESEKEAVEQ